MILAHSIVGLMPVSNSEFSWFWFIGSVISDIDHLFALYRNRIFSWSKIVQVMRLEDKYELRFKTKYLHSLFGAIITSIPISFFDQKAATYYFIAYLIHLLLDWPDIDEKQYLYPTRKKFRGFLPIFSKSEVVFTSLLIILYFYLS